MVVGDMGWVDFGHSTACKVLPRQMGVWQNGWLTGQDGGTSQIKVNPIHVTDHHCHPVLLYSATFKITLIILPFKEPKNCVKICDSKWVSEVRVHVCFHHCLVY